MVSFFSLERVLISFPHKRLPQFIKRINSPWWVFQTPRTAAASFEKADWVVLVRIATLRHRLKIMVGLKKIVVLRGRFVSTRLFDRLYIIEFPAVITLYRCDLLCRYDLAVISYTL